MCLLQLCLSLLLFLFSSHMYFSVAWRSKLFSTSTGTFHWEQHLIETPSLQFADISRTHTGTYTSSHTDTHTHTKVSASGLYNQQRFHWNFKIAKKALLFLRREQPLVVAVDYVQITHGRVTHSPSRAKYYWLENFAFVKEWSLLKIE